MKKSLLSLVLVFGLALLFASCKEHKHSPETHEHEEGTEMHAEGDTDKSEIAMADAYQCPMDCEKGKTYDKEGKCSVCKMDLKKVEEKKGEKEEKEHKHDDEHAGHNH